jgi:glyoxylase-like metal-dependent hydrolase (beta-lactamase superfamily II)
MKLHTINTGLFKLDGGAMHGVVPKSMWSKANPADDNNMCTWAMRCLLIEHGNNRILVDNGMGTKQDAKFFSHFHPHGDDTLDKSLAKLGLTTDDITDVFLTHLHFDHCGGSIKRDGDKASFLKENILPIQESGQLKFIDTAEAGEWLPDIRIRYVKGHTESMMLPQIRCGNQTVFFCADLLPSVAHLSLPWVMAYDMRPLDTLSEKKRLIQEAEANNWILFFEHDPVNECCTLEMTERGIRAKATMTLAETGVNG